MTDLDEKVSTMTALLQAVIELRALEVEVIEKRRQVADLFVQASKLYKITQLSTITNIKRTTIHWLMKYWSSEQKIEDLEEVA